MESTRASEGEGGRGLPADAEQHADAIDNGLDVERIFTSWRALNPEEGVYERECYGFPWALYRSVASLEMSV